MKSLWSTPYRGSLPVDLIECVGIYVSSGLTGIKKSRTNFTATSYYSARSSFFLRASQITGLIIFLFFLRAIIPFSYQIPFSYHEIMPIIEASKITRLKTFKSVRAIEVLWFSCICNSYYFCIKRCRNTIKRINITWEIYLYIIY